MGAEQTTLLDGAPGGHGDVGFDFLVSQMETELEPERKDASEQAARTIQLHVRRRSLQMRKAAAQIKVEKEKQEKQQSVEVNQAVAGAKPGNTWASIVSTAPKPVEKAAPAKLSIVHPQTLMTADKPAVLRRATRPNWADAVESDDDSEDDQEQDAWEEQIRRTDEDSYAMSICCDM